MILNDISKIGFHFVSLAFIFIQIYIYIYICVCVCTQEHLATNTNNSTTDNLPITETNMDSSPSLLKNDQVWQYSHN